MTANTDIKDYSIVTETPDTLSSEEQLRRFYTRYRFASEYCEGKDVLEVACGAGQGLGYLARKARRVVGGDIDEKNLSFARQQYVGRANIEILKLDAHNLPFEDNTFDVVIIFEAIYYLDDPERFLAEANRVIRKDGTIIIGSANREWPGFNPSVYSKKYYSAAELVSMLSKDNMFINPQIYVDCPVEEKSIKDKLISLIKIIAIKLKLIPKTMKGKELFKRIFMGRVKPLPREISDDMIPAGYYRAPAIFDPSEKCDGFKVIFAVSRVNK